MVSRDGELRQLGDALAVAEAGRGGVLLVAGEAGVGKTQLVRAAIGRSAIRTYWAEATQVEPSQDLGFRDLEMCKRYSDLLKRAADILHLYEKAAQQALSPTLAAS